MSRKKKRGFAKPNATGRNDNEQFFPLTYSMARSAAWLSLTPNSRALFIQLRCRFNGRNNGKLRLSYAEAREELGIGRSAIKNAFDQLQDRGFIVLVKDGHWYGRQASEWAVTDKPVDGHPATNAWRRWQQNVVTLAKREAA